MVPTRFVDRGPPEVPCSNCRVVLMIKLASDDDDDDFAQSLKRVKTNSQVMDTLHCQSRTKVKVVKWC